MRALAIVLIMLANSGNPRSDRTGGRQEVRAGDRGKSHIAHGTGGGAGGGGGYTFCDQLQAGDKSGGWGCVNGDLSAGSSSTLTWSAVGSPSTTSGSTCGSPSKSTFSPTAYVKSNNTTFPTGDWSICALFDLTGMSAPYAFWAFGDGTTNYAQTEESNASWIQFGTSGGVTTSLPSFALQFACATQHSGTLQLYFNGTAGASGTGTFTDPGSSFWMFGSDSLTGGYRFAGPFLGGFVTEKKLSGTDVTRLYHAVTCS